MFKLSVRKELACFMALMLLASISAVYAQGNGQSTGSNGTTTAVDEKAIATDLLSQRTGLLADSNSMKASQEEFESLGLTPEVLDSGTTITNQYKSEDGRTLDKVTDVSGVLQSTKYTADSKTLTTQYVNGKLSSATYIDLKTYMGISIEYVSETQQIVKVKDYKTGYALTMDYNPVTGVYGPATLSKEPGLPPGASWCSVTGQFEVPK